MTAHDSWGSSNDDIGDREVQWESGMLWFEEVVHGVYGS